MKSTTSSYGGDITWHIYVGTVATIIPATLAVILRFIARRVSRAGLWWDDYTIAIALVFNWVMAAMRWAQILLLYYGSTCNALSPEKVEEFGKTFLVVQLVYFLNAVFTKASLILLYYRIFGVVRKFRWALWVSGFLVIAYWIATTLVTVFECWPIAKLWTPILQGRCINVGAFGRWSGVANVAIDILILCLPYPMAWRLQTNLRQKVILTCILLLGTFVCIVSILRVTSFGYNNLGSSTCANIDPATWSSIEQSVGILCACLPTLRPFFRWLYDSSRNNTKNRDSALSNLPKQTPLACRTSQSDEENALDAVAASAEGPARVSLAGDLECGQYKPDSRPLSQQTGQESPLETDLPRPQSFA